jgi:hypothetical protein
VTRSRADFAALFKTAAAPALAPSLPQPDDFADEFGHRRATDEAMLAWLHRCVGSAVSLSRPHDEPVALDVLLWRALASREPADQRAAASRLGGAKHIGEIISAGDDMSLEVATEQQLCALHALAWLQREDEALKPFVERSVLWLIDEVQPDNATNHPWAIHAFADLASRHGPAPHPRSAEAGLYVETLLHNACVTLGRPDLRSALILHDAAAWLNR